MSVPPSLNSQSFGQGMTPDESSEFSDIKRAIAVAGLAVLICKSLSVESHETGRIPRVVCVHLR